MIWLVIAAWWFIGFLVLLALSPSGVRYITWQDLAVCMIVGWLGPVIIIVVVITMLVRADFWTKPVFGKRGRER